MKAVVLLAGAAAVLAQNFSGEPACATPILASAIVSAGCQLSDQACQCNSATSASIGQIAVSLGLLTACGAGDLLQAQSAGAALCSNYLATASGMTTTANATATTTAFSNSTVTTTKATATTGSGATASVTSTGTSSAKASSTSSSSGAGATPLMLGAGALAAVMGVVAAL